MRNTAATLKCITIGDGWIVMDRFARLLPTAKPPENKGSWKPHPKVPDEVPFVQSLDTSGDLS